MSRFSVVIPAFNARSTIERAVASVLKQSRPAYEIIIVDDGSQDDTVRVCEAIIEANRDAEIRLISLKTNRGPAHARNIGWSVASGDYVAFLDADDEWLPNKLLIQERALRDAGAILVGQTYGSLNRFRASVFKVSKMGILIRNYFWTPSVVVKRDVGERFCESLRRCEDHLLFCMLTIKYDRSYYVSEPLVVEHKLPLGEDGLSKSIMRMQLGNWRLYWLLLREGYINVIIFVAMEIVSTVKGFVRPLRIALWRLRRGKEGMHGRGDDSACGKSDQ